MYSSGEDKPMVLQSVSLMTAIDILILGVVGYAATDFLKRRGRRAGVGIESGSLAIIAGLLLVALLYLADLVIMHVFPSFMPRAEAMALMIELYLNSNWVIALFGIGSICFGFTTVDRRTVTLIHGLEARDRDLSRELAERKRVEEALEEAQRIARIGNWRWSIPRDQLISCSPEYARIHGVGFDQIDNHMNRQLENVIHVNDRAHVEEEFRRFDETGADYELEYRIVRPDKEVRHILEIGKVVIDDHGRAVEHVGTIQDLTERKQAEEALRERDVQIKQALKLANMGSWIWDDVIRRFEYVSTEFANLHGYDVDEFVRLSQAGDQDMFNVHPDDIERVQQETFEHNLHEKDYQLTYRIIRKDGTVRTLRDVSQRVFDGNSKLVRSIGCTQDITDFVEVYEKLRQAQKMEAVGQLTAGVAHDFNNMLAVIWGAVELLEDEIGKDNPLLATVLRATKRGADLTQRLLAFSRQQVLSPEIINANNLISDTTGLLRRTLEEHIDIETVTAAGLWNCEVDPAQLENALVNLALNARDAMPDGGKLTIETANALLDDEYAAAQAEVAPGQYVMLAVTDTGTGIPPDQIEHVFEPFFTTKAVGKGSGLGLAMIYGFVKQSGGHVMIYSEEGEGTTIKLYLPRSTETEAAEKKPETDEVPIARGETVLVVEDDPDLRTLAVALLGNLGYQVMEAGTAAAALEELGSATRVNLLLTDVVLPGGMNGRELATEIVRRDPEIKVLYMSGYTKNAILHHGRLDADAELLQKPFRRADLARAVRKVLDGPSA